VGVGSSVLLCGQESSQLPVFRGGTDAVTITVSVRRRNAPVAGLTARDFELVDNGVPQTVELETTDTVPVDVTVLFGQYQVQGTLGDRLTSDLTKIARWLRPVDRLQVITYARDVREVIPMDPPRPWEHGGLAATAMSESRAALDLEGRDQDDLDPRTNPRRRGHALFDALLLALARPPELGRRHLIVVFSWSVGWGSVLADGSILQAVAARTDALLHVAFSWGMTTDPRVTKDFVPAQYIRWSLAGAAAATGGAVHDASNGVGAFESIFDDFRQSYLLHYAVTGVPPGGWHTVVVRTPGFPEYDVRARTGYMGR